MESRKNGYDKTIDIVTSLDGAIAARASKQPGSYLMLEVPSMLLSEDVCTPSYSFRENTSNGFGDISNKAIAVNPTLQAKYGKLDVLNGGRGVVFYSSEDGDAVMECDGLMLNSTVVLLNEAKTHFHESDAKRLAGKGAMLSSREKLERIISCPGKYSSEPPEVMEQLAGHAVVPIASSPSFSKEASRACAALGIHTLSQDGSGFAVTLHEQPAGA